MDHTENRLWSFYTNAADALIRGGALTLPDSGEGDLSARSAERRAFRAGFDDTVTANVLYRFARELREGDFVLLHRGRGQSVDVCRVTGEYAYDGAHRRSIRWIKRLLPDDISTGAQREITYASASPLFEVKHYAAEFFADLGLCILPAPQNCTAAERFAARWSMRRMSA